jgi:hypothetical protein
VALAEFEPGKEGLPMGFSGDGWAFEGSKAVSVQESPLLMGQ